MKDNKLIKKDGQVMEVLTNGQYMVQLEPGIILRCYLNGKMRQNKIRVILGDRVSIEIPPSIHMKNAIGRITFRNK